MTGTPTPPNTTSVGISYSLIPLEPLPPDYIEDPTVIPPPPQWKSVTFNDLPNAIVLNGFRVASKFYVLTCSTPPGGGNPVCTTTYQPWEIVSQRLERTGPSRQVYGTDDGTQLFGAEPRVYNENESATAGITDGTTYEYIRVFNKADISYWPRASTSNQPLIKNPTTLPSGDEEYLIDTLTSFVPDSRESVTISYKLTTTYKYTPMFGGLPIGDAITETDIFTFTQDVLQETDNVGEKIEAYLERSYYSDGKYHIQLHENDAPDLYDAGGELIRPQDFKAPIYEEQSNGMQKLINTVTPVTADDILKEVLNTSVADLESLIHMIDDYEFPQ